LRSPLHTVVDVSRDYLSVSDGRATVSVNGPTHSAGRVLREEIAPRKNHQRAEQGDRSTTMI
jgi:hypothetical protein